MFSIDAPPLSPSEWKGSLCGINERARAGVNSPCVTLGDVCIVPNGPHDWSASAAQQTIRGDVVVPYHTVDYEQYCKYIYVIALYIY
jgi:hypothetical protein